jgi:hypothetical protein
VPGNPGLGDALQVAEGVHFLAEDDEAFLNSVHEQGLAELEPGNVAMAGTAEEPDRCDRCEDELPRLTLVAYRGHSPNSA